MDEERRVIDFEAAVRARKPQPRATSAPFLFLLLVALAIASLAFGLDGRLVSTLATLFTSAQCTLEIQADCLFPPPSGRRAVHPCEFGR